MYIKFIFPIFFILFLFKAFSQTAEQPIPELSYSSLLKQFEELKAVAETEISAEGIVLNQDVANIHLRNGKLVKLSNIEGMECAYLFIGDGVFKFSPPTKVEQEQLFRFYETDSLRYRFERMFMITDGSFGNKYFSQLQFIEVEDLEDFKIPLDDCLDYIVDSDKSYLDDDISFPFLENKLNHFFYSQINTKDFGPLFFEINPFDNEEVKLMRKTKSGVLFAKKNKEVINQFELSNNRDRIKEKFDNSFQSLYNRININIEDNLDINAKCIEVIKRQFPDVDWMMFYLYDDLNVDSVFFGDDKYTQFHRGEDNYELWIKLPKDSNWQKEYSLTIYYSGEVLERTDYGWIDLKSSDYWYPNLESNGYSIFDVTFEYPENYTVVGIGNEISYEEGEDIKTSRWKTDYPVAYASFNFGNFKRYDFPDKDGIDVSVYISEAGHREMARVLVNYYDIFSTGDPEEKIGTDVLASTQFYTKIFGKIPIKTLSVTEIPAYHGQAFPGMVHLSWFNYQGVQYDGSDEEFRAHEVAHQWWGLGVDSKTYHDWWLGEGFAEYSALMFIQAAFNDNDMFFDLLNKWKDEIFSNRVYLFTTGQEAGPIWLGYRTNTSTTKGDYNLIIYKKGAWILHMMRNMLIDLKTMNEDLFKGMMQDYFKTYFGKRATTQDFKKIADRHFGEDMSWFFNQYVYGTDVPTYNFSYKSEETNDGKYKVTCKIVQEDVPDNFKMYVPIKIEFDNDRFARIRVEVKQKETIINLPLLPEEPEDIIFNDLESVLCKVNYDSWDDE